MLLRVLELALFTAVGIAAVIYLVNFIRKLTQRPKSRLEMDIEESLNKPKRGPEEKK